MQKAKRLEHFYSDFNGVQLSKSQYHETPSDQTVQQAMALGRVAVGDADVIYQPCPRTAADTHAAVPSGYLVVIVAPSNGLTRNVYRDMYRIIDSQ